MTSELASSQLTDRTISFYLDPSSGVPPYLQLIRQVQQALRMGVLQPGDRLPTVKMVVAEIAVNPNTVLKAYRELEYEGLVEGRPGVGTFVTGRPAGPPPDIQARLARQLDGWVNRARGEGLDDQAMEAMLQAALRARSGQVVA